VTQTQTQTVTQTVQQTTQAPVTTQHTMTLIQTFTGSGISNTATFTIPTNFWEIVWSYVPANQFGLMTYTVNQPGNNSILDMGGNSNLMNGTSNEYFGPGTYYLSVDSGNVSSWTIKIYG